MPTLTEIACQIRDKARRKPVGTLTLAEFADSGRVVRVWSDVLQEELIFAADNARVPETEERVIYRARELAVVYGNGGDITPEKLRLLHETKKAFGGEIITTDEGERNLV